MLFGSIGLGVGSYFITVDETNTCGYLKSTILMTIALHILNMLVALVFLFNCERHLSGTWWQTGAILGEVGLVLYMNIMYFTAQDAGCMGSSPKMYFYLHH